MFVGPQLVRGGDDAAHQQVFEVDGAIEMCAQDGEEFLELAYAQRLERTSLPPGNSR